MLQFAFKLKGYEGIVSKLQEKHRQTAPSKSTKTTLQRLTQMGEGWGTGPAASAELSRAQIPWETPHLATRGRGTRKNAAWSPSARGPPQTSLGWVAGKAPGVFISIDALVP